MRVARASKICKDAWLRAPQSPSGRFYPGLMLSSARCGGEGCCCGVSVTNHPVVTGWSSLPSNSCWEGARWYTQICIVWNSPRLPLVMGVARVILKGLSRIHLVPLLSRPGVATGLGRCSHQCDVVVRVFAVEYSRELQKQKGTRPGRRW